MVRVAAVEGLRGAYLEQPRPATICATYDVKAMTIGMTQYSLQRKGFLSVFTAIYLLREDGKKKAIVGGTVHGIVETVTQVDTNLSCYRWPTVQTAQSLQSMAMTSCEKTTTAVTATVTTTATTISQQQQQQQPKKAGTQKEPHH